MTIFYDAEVRPEAQTTFIRDVPVGAGRFFMGQMPRQDSDDNTIDWNDVTRTNRTAKFRAFDGAIAKSKRDTASTSRVRLLPLGSSLDLGEYERLQLEFARTGGTNTSILEKSIYDDSLNLTNEVLNRLELAWGDVFTDGKLTINENGYQGEADFAVPANQIVTAGTAWTNLAASTPLTNLQAWQDVMIANGNGPAGSIRTSNQNIRLLMRNTEVINAAYGSLNGRTIATLPDINSVLASLGLPSLEPAFDEVLSVDDVDTRVIPIDRVLLTPANLGDLGYTAWGVSATALELVNSAEADFSFEEAAGVVGVVVKDGPPFRQTTFVDATAMPILTGAKKLFIADVA
jgi:hypothetical protein